MDERAYQTKIKHLEDQIQALRKGLERVQRALANVDKKATRACDVSRQDHDRVAKIEQVLRTRQ